MSLTFFSSGNYRIIHALVFAANYSVVRYGMTVYLLLKKKNYKNDAMEPSVSLFLKFCDHCTELYRLTSSVCRSQWPLAC